MCVMYETFHFMFKKDVYGRIQPVSNIFAGSEITKSLMEDMPGSYIN